MEAVYQRIERQHEMVFPVVIPSTETASATPLNAASLDASASLQLEVEWISTAGEGASRPFFDNLTETFSKTPDDRYFVSPASATRRRRSRYGIVTLMGCLHDPAIVQQFTCILNTFAGSLLDVCWIV